MTNKKQNANVQGTKAESKEIVKNAIANEITISKQKHIIENRANLSAKQLKAIRTKRRNAIKSFCSAFFVANQTKNVEQLKEIKSKFVAFVKSDYSIDINKCTASELYSAKEQKTISDINELLLFVRK